ncbi:MAG: SGNH/GDSL hydrolase family protein [Gemmatales bacterium]
MRCLSYLLIALCGLPSITQAQEKKQPKPDPSLQKVVDVPGLPRILLIGDSISMGYTLPVRKLYEGTANVHRPPENGGPTTTGLAKIDSWLTVNGSNKWDVIHFNWGLHDLKVTKEGDQVSPDEYEKNLRLLVKKLKATGAKLIWATTTPVPGGKLNPPRKNEDVIQYNAIALKIMKEEGIAIDDLYAAVLPKQSDWQRPENVHFTEAGSKALADIVFKAIDQQLKAQAK